MTLPFTRSEFLALFADYNQAVWPLQLALVALGLVAAGTSLLAGGRLGAWVALLLALLWAWTGVVYHWGYFAAINPIAVAFGAAFVAQSALLLWSGMVRRRLAFRPRLDAPGAAGGLLIAYALVGYPVLGAMVGHAYPAAPTFGVPCPTVIFTLGLLLWLDGGVPRSLLAIPVAWALLGTSAAISLGMVEDYGLTLAGLLGLAGAVHKNRLAGAGPLMKSRRMSVSP